MPVAEMGDLYFKLLTRVTAKIRAVRGTAAAEATMDIIHYARRESGKLDDFVEFAAERWPSVQR